MRAPGSSAPPESAPEPGRSTPEWTASPPRPRPRPTPPALRLNSPSPSATAEAPWPPSPRSTPTGRSSSCGAVPAASTSPSPVVPPPCPSAAQASATGATAVPVQLSSRAEKYSRNARSESGANTSPADRCEPGPLRGAIRSCAVTVDASPVGRGRTLSEGLRPLTAVQAVLARSESEGRRRMLALHRGGSSGLGISPQPLGRHRSGPRRCGCSARRQPHRGRRANRRVPPARCGDEGV